MADEIKLNPAEAETAINKLNSVVLDMEIRYKELVDNHSKLKGQWDGESASMFAKYADIMGSNLMGRINGLRELINNLDKAKETFLEEDKNLIGLNK